jgi:hypothetical protein
LDLKAQPAKTLAELNLLPRERKAKAFQEAKNGHGENVRGFQRKDPRKIVNVYKLPWRNWKGSITKAEQSRGHPTPVILG